MKLKKGQVIEADITGIAFGGKGLARINGMAVFVEQAVPGDRAAIRLTKIKKSHAQARVVELIEESRQRVDAPCEYSGFCGGCTWQYLDYRQQLVYKRQHVIECLEHIGRIESTDVRPTMPSPDLFGYRNKMEFSCSDKRWLLPDELGKPEISRDFAVGLHVPGTFDKIIDTRACLLQPALGNQILEDVRTFIRTSGVPVYGLRSHAGFWRFVMLRHSVAFDEWMVNIVTATEDRKTVAPLGERLTSKYPQVVCVINNISSRKAGIAVGEYEWTVSGSATIADKIGSFVFDISANSFFQTNTRGAEQLYGVVEDFAGLTGQETVLDLYSGTGTIPILLSNACREVIGIEINPSTVKDAETSCRINGISNCRFIQGDIRNCLQQIKMRPDLLIIDPPRAGMHKDVVEQIRNMATERIVYVSCNPATLARDLGLLKEAYRVLAIQPVDMFPHTYHVEAVAELVRMNS